MNEKELLKYNCRCAKFLGWKNLNDDSFPEYVNPLGDFYQLKELKFHSDWNWIMEVVEKIESLGYMFQTSYNEVIINNLQAFLKECETGNPDLKQPSTIIHIYEPEDDITKLSKKEAVVEAINQFLIWYEQNK